jgi:hypothetical protein
MAALTLGRIHTMYTIARISPMKPVKTQVSTISAIQWPFDEPAAVNAPVGRGMASAMAQMETTIETTKTAMMRRPSKPNTSPIIAAPPIGTEQYSRHSESCPPTPNFGWIVSADMGFRPFKKPLPYDGPDPIRLLLVPAVEEPLIHHFAATGAGQGAIRRCWPSRN